MKEEQHEEFSKARSRGLTRIKDMWSQHESAVQMSEIRDEIVPRNKEIFVPVISKKPI